LESLPGDLPGQENLRLYGFDSFFARSVNESAQAFSEELARYCKRVRGFNPYSLVNSGEIEQAKKVSIDF